MKHFVKKSIEPVFWSRLSNIKKLPLSSLFTNPLCIVVALRYEMQQSVLNIAKNCRQYKLDDPGIWDSSNYLPW